MMKGSLNVNGIELKIVTLASGPASAILFTVSEPIEEIMEETLFI